MRAASVAVTSDMESDYQIPEQLERWATGKNPSPDVLIDAAHQLERTGGDHARLARPLTAWIDQHDLVPHEPATPRRHIEPPLRPEPPGLDIGL